MKYILFIACLQISCLLNGQDNSATEFFEKSIARNFDIPNKKEKETDELLKHEQGHFDIAKLCALEMSQLAVQNIVLKNFNLWKKRF